MAQTGSVIKMRPEDEDRLQNYNHKRKVLGKTPLLGPGTYLMADDGINSASDAALYNQEEKVFSRAAMVAQAAAITAALAANPTMDATFETAMAALDTAIDTAIVAYDAL